MSDTGTHPGAERSEAGAAESWLPFPRHVRVESAWARRGWVFFACVLAFSTAEANPGWTYPDFRLNLPVGFWLGLVAVGGAATGWIMARYRLAGLVAGAVAGSGSLLTALHVFEGFTSFPRTAVVLVEVAGLCPGLFLYYLLHAFCDCRKKQRCTVDAQEG